MTDVHPSTPTPPPHGTAPLRATLEEHLGPEGVTYPSAMWIIRAAVAGS